MRNRVWPDIIFFIAVGLANCGVGVANVFNGDKYIGILLSLVGLACCYSAIRAYETFRGKIVCAVCGEAKSMLIKVGNEYWCTDCEAKDR